MRRFIAIAEKELELYYRHVALYGDPNNRNLLSMLDGPSRNKNEKGNHGTQDIEIPDMNSYYLSETEADSTEMELSETEVSFEDENSSMNESDSEEEEDNMFHSNGDQEREVYFTKKQDESVSLTTGSSSMPKHSHYYNNNNNQYL